MGTKSSLDFLFGPDESLPKCAYGCGYDDEEMLFRHKVELTCATCLESYDFVITLLIIPDFLQSTENTRGNLDEMLENL